MLVIERAEDVTARWLTELLMRVGALRSGAVAQVRAQAESSTTAQRARLLLTYTPSSAGGCPSSLFLKLSPPGSLFASDSEVRYYTEDYRSLPDAPLPYCYDAAFDQESGAYHLLLADLTETHYDLWRSAPTLPVSVAVVQALARMHAHWWGTERLAAGGHLLPNSADVQRYAAAALPGVEPMLADAGDELTAEERDLVRRAAAVQADAMATRLRQRPPLTLVHGDVNPGNVLVPRGWTRPTPEAATVEPGGAVSPPVAPSPADSADGQVYLIDRQPFAWSLTTWLGVSDVAYMITHRWTAAERRAMEREVLRAYHQALVDCGVTGYGWDEMIADYNLCAGQSLFVPALFCVRPATREKMRWVWLPELRHTVAALRDQRAAGGRI